MRAQGRALPILCVAPSRIRIATNAAAESEEEGGSALEHELSGVREVAYKRVAGRSAELGTQWIWPSRTQKCERQPVLRHTEG